MNQTKYARGLKELPVDQMNHMQRLAKLAESAPDKEIPYVALTHPENRGLVRSALQKYIRRGRYEDALRMAAHMKGPTSKELQYLHYSPAISVEDIGHGDPEGIGCA
jgi:hypothetical protein